MTVRSVLKNMLKIIVRIWREYGLHLAPERLPASWMERGKHSSSGIDATNNVHVGSTDNSGSLDLVNDPVYSMLPGNIYYHSIHGTNLQD